MNLEIETDLFVDEDLLVLFAAMLRTAYKKATANERVQIDIMTQWLADHFVSNNLWGRNDAQQLVHSFSGDDSDPVSPDDIGQDGKMGRGYNRDYPWAFRIKGMHMAFDDSGHGIIKIRNSAIDEYRLLALFFEALGDVPKDGNWLLSCLRIALEYEDDGETINDHSRVVEFTNSLANKYWPTGALVLVSVNGGAAKLAQIGPDLVVTPPIRQNTLVAPITSDELVRHNVRFYNTQPVKIGERNV